MEVWVQERSRRIEIQEADAHVVYQRVCTQCSDCFEDELFEGLDEGPVVDAGAVVELGGVAAAVSDEEIDGVEFRGSTAGGEGFDGGFEEAGADVPCEGEGFELREDATKVFADVVFGVELSPFGKRGGLFSVQSFQAYVYL